MKSPFSPVLLSQDTQIPFSDRDPSFGFSFDIAQTYFPPSKRLLNSTFPLQTQY